MTDQDSRSTLPELRDTRSYSIQRVFVYREEIEFIETDDMRYPSCLPVAPSAMDATVRALFLEKGKVQVTIAL